MNQKMKMIFGVIVLSIALGWKLYQEWDQHQIPQSDGFIARMEEGLFAEKFTPVKTRGAGLELLEGCRLITGRNSDGDSFHVKHEKGENQFRLYFVDTPESEYKEYGGGENNGDRLDEQGKYFNGMGRDDVAKVGKDAKAFVLNLLKEERFKILTKWEDVVRPGREYCFVILNWEGREIYLHELLVAQGLGGFTHGGRICPKGVDGVSRGNTLRSGRRRWRGRGLERGGLLRRMTLRRIKRGVASERKGK